MKTYVLMLSTQFPAGHIRAGELTYFKEKLLRARGEFLPTTDEWVWKITPYKIHTIRANYSLWERRFAKIERGEACLSIREWSGSPRQSKQVEIARLTKDDGVGIEQLEFLDGNLGLPRIGIVYQRKLELAYNDGLSFEDWESWFKGYDLTQPMAIIHFTPFRY